MNRLDSSLVKVLRKIVDIKMDAVDDGFFFHHKEAENTNSGAVRCGELQDELASSNSVATLSVFIADFGECSPKRP
jgi:hypothetical protein